MQGVIAEYERAKFLERSRRGKRHAAQEGRVGILCHAPYGYRYVNKQEGGGEARFEIVFDEARIVQQVFAWVGEARCTINEVCRRLHQALATYCRACSCALNVGMLIVGVPMMHAMRITAVLGP